MGMVLEPLLLPTSCISKVSPGSEEGVSWADWGRHSPAWGWDPLGWGGGPWHGRAPRDGCSPGHRMLGLPEPRPWGLSPAVWEWDAVRVAGR